MKKRIMTVIITAMVVSTFLVGCDSTKSNYEKAVKYQEDQEYESAIEYFKKVGEYEDSNERLKECEILYAIQTDTTVPVVEGIKEGEVVELEFGQDFNLENYLKDTINITDNVSGKITQYLINTSESIFDAKTANIDTNKPGEYEVKVTASDEAGNEAEIKFILKIKPLHITRDNMTPVIYEGDYGKIKLSNIRYGTEWGITGYRLTFDIENNTDNEMAVLLGATYINDYGINAYTDISSVAPGKKGSMDSYIRDEEITSEMENFTQIESNIFVSTNVMLGKSYLQIPVVIDRDVFE
ncbi:hypothetical protein [Frisingicoccus sp.]|uniref:hypothetical protein n=1 Tax=Frisingicoccus sp. TaxID=1918627 RepID=UPI003AB781EE